MQGAILMRHSKIFHLLRKTMCILLDRKMLVYFTLLWFRYWWNTRIFPFAKKSYFHRAQWRYYFYLSRVRILVSPWLPTWLANYKRASRSGVRPVLLKFHSQNGFEVWRRCSYWWLSRWAAKFSHRYFFQAWRTFRKICRKKKVVFFVGISSVSMK